MVLAASGVPPPIHACWITCWITNGQMCAQLASHDARRNFEANYLPSSCGGEALYLPKSVQLYVSRAWALLMVMVSQVSQSASTMDPQGVDPEMNDGCRRSTRCCVYIRICPGCPTWWWWCSHRPPRCQKGLTCLFGNLPLCIAPRCCRMDKPRVLLVWTVRRTIAEFLPSTYK